MAIDTPRSPLVLLGLDAGDLDFINRWTREGYLPTIASIMKRGCWARTAGPEMCTELGSNLSLMSGISRSQHGYYWVRQLKPGTYDLRIFTAHDADAVPFWSHLGGRGKKVAIIDAPDSKLVARLPCVQLANWAAHVDRFSMLPASAEPPGLLEEARRVFGPQIKVSEFVVDSSLQEDQYAYRRLLERAEKKGRLCRHLLARDRFDLVVTAFYEAHLAAHRFWKYRPEARSSHIAAGRTELTHAIRDVYQASDREMGLLLAELPDDANVFIFASSGMIDQYPTTGLIEDFCYQLGYQAKHENSRRALSPLSSFRRMVPEQWRVALSQYLPIKTQERLLSDNFRNSIDWQKTTAFPIPSLYTSFVRVNLRGREPRGIVEPGADYDALLKRFEADLKQLLDPHTGEPAIKQITRTDQTFHCGPPAALPDLFVEWQSGAHFMERVIHPKAELVQRKHNYHRDSFHSTNGFIAAAGPGIRARGVIGDVSLLDLAPTFLALMGEAIPHEMTGHPIKNMLRLN